MYKLSGKIEKMAEIQKGIITGHIYFIPRMQVGRYSDLLEITFHFPSPAQNVGTTAVGGGWRLVKLSTYLLTDLQVKRRIPHQLLPVSIPIDLSES